jgi:hypothetical protein
MYETSTGLNAFGPLGAKEYRYSLTSVGQRKDQKKRLKILTPHCDLELVSTSVILSLGKLNAF